MSSLTRSPRGMPVPITATDASVEQILAAAPRVQNVVPEGSTWDGKTDLPMDEATFRQIVSEIEPNGAAAADGAGAPAATTAPATGRGQRGQRSASAAEERRSEERTRWRRLPNGCS